MDVLEFGNFADFAERHGSDWQRIANSSEAATVFQTWEWVQSWWTHHRSGKRFKGLVFQENGAAIGCAALFQGAFPSLFRSLKFVGAGGSDYLDIVAQPGSQAVVADEFIAHLQKTARRWDWVDLQQVRPDAVASQLKSVDGSRRVKADIWRGETCPFLTLPADYETFRRSLNKKLRYNVGYYARNLDKAYVVELRTATSETLEDDLEAFFFLHQRRWNQRWMPGAFASRRERAFHETVATRLLESGMLRLHTLSLDGEVQAALYCFQKARRCYYYLGGFEPKYARLSLGTVLTAHAIRFAIESDGATEFDFLRGDEGYKYKWGAVDRYNTRVSITRPGLRPALLALGGRMAFTAEQKLKSYMHRRHGAAAESSPSNGTKNAKRKEGIENGV